MNKKKFNALERLFSASIESGVEKNDRLSIVQSRAKIYKELESEGLCESVTWQDGMLRVSGYVITHKGHFVYCELCSLIEDLTDYLVEGDPVCAKQPKGFLNNHDCNK